MRLVEFGGFQNYSILEPLILTRSRSTNLKKGSWFRKTRSEDRTSGDILPINEY